MTARAAIGSAFWSSEPDIAYSVDNLAPAAVQQFEGDHVAGRDDSGARVASAVYAIRVSTGSLQRSVRVTLVK